MMLDNAPVYDVESFPNLFSIDMEMLHSDVRSTWEISQFRDDRAALFAWFNWLHDTQTPMIGFNTLNYDYPLIHFIYTHPDCTVADIYEKSQSIINGQDKFGHIIWDRDRFAPQIDLFKINHFDNKAKTTSLKALQINMRSDEVVESAVPFGTVLTEQQINQDVIPYNKHDVKETKKFALINMDAINFRIGLIPDFGIDVLNYNDTKIGERMLVNRIGHDICYDRSSGRKQVRQTVRHRIALNEIIFPYIQFQHPEFNRILDYMRSQVLLPADIEEIGKEETRIVTKGVFTGLKARVADLDFVFGLGGIHASVEAQRITATEEWLIRDIDVAQLYPNIAIKNRIAPAHLGEPFLTEYAKLPVERKEWQARKGKKCVEANSIKLASNGVYGKSNDKFSPFFDTQYTMATTINGQLMIAMLAEWLIAVPTVKIIMANTDGITYYIHCSMLDQAKAVEKRWEEFTLLTLESQHYDFMFIRDVNSYIAGWNE